MRPVVQNGRADECDVGFDPSVTDVNRDLTPDECDFDIVLLG